MLFIQTSLSAQIAESSSLEDQEDQLVMYGFIDGVLPFQLSYTGEEECEGQILYGDKEIKVEGRCLESSFTLYEFDNHARVVSSVVGAIDGDVYEMTWHNYDHSESLPITSISNSGQIRKVKVYSHDGESKFDQIVLRPDDQKIYISSDQEKNIRWTSYTCPQARYACQVDYGASKSTLSLSDRVISIGSQLHKWSEDISYRYISDEGHHFFYSYAVPFLDQKNFDKQMNFIIKNEIERFMKTVDIDDSDIQPDQRWRFSSQGEFTLSLVHPKYISGYLHIQDRQTHRSTTYPFTYDRVKNKMVKLRDIWRDDFNFSYFLKSLIENQKREVISEEKGEIRQLLKSQPFSHFGFTPGAMVFYTDFHFIYGRRTIYVPYQDIQTFIEDKTMSHFINEVLQDE